MNGSIICTNGRFSFKAIEMHKEYEIETPKEGRIYTIREIVHHQDGNKGIRLVEIKNPAIPVVVPNINNFYMEPAFSISRFTQLDTSKITEEEIERMIVEQDRKINRNL